jgi:hypothetical protein
MYLAVFDRLFLRFIAICMLFLLSLPCGVILQTVFMSCDFKRGRLESLLGQDQGIPVEDCLTFWHPTFTFKFWHTVYVKCE